MGWFWADLLVHKVLLKPLGYFTAHQTLFHVPEHKPSVYSTWDV